MEINGVISQNSIQNLRINEQENINQNEQVSENRIQNQESRQLQTDTLELTSQNQVTGEENIQDEVRAQEVQEDLTRAITENPNASVLAQSGNMSAEKVANLL